MCQLLLRRDRLRALSSTLLTLTLGVALPAPGRAHGRDPSLGQIAFDPGDPDLIVVRATWGTLSSTDGGARWTWQCAAAIPFDRERDDPSIAIMPGGLVLAGTYDGLRASDGSRCSWGPVPALPAYVTDVIRDPHAAETAWAILSPGTDRDSILRSDDGGLSWSPMGELPERALVDRLRVADSDPSRVYASGAIPLTSTTAQRGILFRSDDRGVSFRALPVDLQPGEITLHALAVDPADADRLFARVVRRSNDDETAERLLRSLDGGESWQTVLEELTEIAGVVVSEGGSTVWVGSADGGLVRSQDGGDSFEVLDPSLRVRCLARRADELWICVDDVVHELALGRSMDGGETIEPIWRFEDVSSDVGCPASSPVGMLCPMYWPDMQYDLGIVARPDGSLEDGGLDAERSTAGSCGCRVTTGRDDAVLALCLALLSAAVARGCRRRRSPSR